MLFPILGLSLMNTFRPYFRKHIMDDISIGEFIFVNSIVIGTLSFLYVYIVKKEKISKLFTLKPFQYGCLFFIGAATVLSSLVFLSYEQSKFLEYSFLKRGISAILVVFLGYFVFKEELKWKQIGGIGLIVAGTAFIASK